MGATSISSPHIAVQPTTTPSPARTRASASHNEHAGTAVRPAQSSSAAPGTGLKVDKHA